SAYQLALRPEPMADESVAVARQLADFHQGSAAASLALDQLERGIEHSLIGQFPPRRLRAMPGWRTVGLGRTGHRQQTYIFAGQHATIDARRSFNLSSRRRQ